MGHCLSGKLMGGKGLYLSAGFFNMDFTPLLAARVFRAGGIQISILGEEMVFSALGAEKRKLKGEQVKARRFCKNLIHKAENRRDPRRHMPAP